MASTPPTANNSQRRQRSLWLSLLLFGALVFAEPDLDRMQSLALQRYGQPTANLVAEWRQTIGKMQGMSERDKLKAANNFFNGKIKWVEDPVAWGQIVDARGPDCSGQGTRMWSPEGHLVAARGPVCGG